MDDEEENFNERHAMDNDFEGGTFVEGEFFYEKRREKRKQTKDDVLYGVFNDDSDDGQAGRGGAGVGKRTKDFKTPVAFVSSGVQGSAAPQEDVMDVDEDDPFSRPKGLGLGASVNPSTTATPKPPPVGMPMFVKSRAETIKTDVEQEEGEDEELFPSAFGQRIRKQAQERQQRQKETSSASKVANAKAAEQLRTSLGIGEFESHTKGIGAKLLAKMGFTGKLGKNETGRMKALEVSLRPKNSGLGSCQADMVMRKKKQISKEEETGVKEEEQQDKKKVGPQPKMWKKRNQEKREKREYKTAEELLRESEGAAEAKMAQSTIIDMRGKQARVVTNMESLNALERETEMEDATPMPELQHNLRLMVDLAEANIKQLDAKIFHEKDTAVVLGREAERLRGEVQLRANQLARVRQLLQLVTECKQRCDKHPKTVTLAYLQQTYTSLRRQFQEEYVMYDLAAVALAQALPLVATHFAAWSPLQNPSYGTELLTTWRELLESQSAADALYPEMAVDSDAFLRLLNECVLPHLRTQLLNRWEPRDPEPALAFFEAWEGLLPAHLRGTLLQQLVVPKLQTAVDAWDPRQETIAIHTWLHPWLPLLGASLEGLYPTIRHRLAACLQQWHPSDGSALALLGPWKPVFSQADWDTLLARSIVPKLQWAMQELVINPQHQVLDQFHWLMAWKSAMPPQHLITMLESFFFPKLQQVLYQWLMSTPNYEEVTQWYLGWKSLFPEELLAQERVRRGFNHALDMMNQALGGHVPLPQMTPPPPPVTAPSASAGSAPAPRPAELSFKDLVEAFAAQHDLAFVPKAGRTHEGLQVWGFGAVSVVLDLHKQMLHAQIGDRWMPVSLEMLLGEHHQRVSKPGR